ncbi:glycoside hydrolase family 36 protein [Microbacterium allomyrinae]|uniref:Alpha-galactosidase n=1 Tax=Microbacterium allomyrinae TaxID=2830666 RepID=A0A9X1S344_9MICO|nr:glycoside hydrolase family 36 protein [Microbacterium allomyrinae]MCC2031575.1 alpha-galactosidase [Microbacterium allomyrinae]
MSTMTEPHTLEWHAAPFALRVDVDDAGRPRLTRMLGDRAADVAIALPLVEIVTTTCSKRAGTRFDDTELGARLRYRSHRHRAEGERDVFEVDLADAETGLAATVTWSTVPGSEVVTVSTTVVNEHPTRRHELLFVSSVALGDARWDADDTTVHSAANTWLSEFRWQTLTYRERGGVDVAMRAHGGASTRSAQCIVGTGTWSTSENLPMGAFEAPGGGTLLWQLEANAGWSWRVAESPTRDGGALRLVLAGADALTHGWSRVLAPGESHAAPDATFAWSTSGLEPAVAALTAHRRRERAVYRTDRPVAVVYNDYMNTLMAEPTTDRLLPLIAAVGRVRADVFCVDAGWYSGEPGWWHTVGEWQESATRFPGGFREVFDAIRAAGMLPGLWLEPEAVGVRSPICEELPAEAFLQRGGVRLVEDGRHVLDFRHPAAVAHMDAVMDRLIADYGLRYVKFDANLNPTPGTDVGGLNPIEGLRRTAVAWLDWIDALHARHPDLIIENCASGGMRCDWQTLSHFALLATSDQQDESRVPPISANAPLVVPPEIAGVWSYPQAGMSPGAVHTTLVNSLLRRPILSGHLDRMDEKELALVATFVDVHRGLRDEIATAEPVWPTGLPGWDDPWVTWALCCASSTLVSIVHRFEETVAEQRIPLTRLRVSADAPVIVEQLFPPRPASWRIDGGDLVVRLDGPDAVVFRLQE